MFALTLAALASGCGSSDPNPAPQAQGDAAAADAAVADAGTGAVLPDAPPGSAADTAGVGAPAAPAVCLESPAPRFAGRPVVTVDVELTYAGKPIVFGEPFALPTGTLTVTNLRFYLSDLALLRSNGDPVPVDLIAADGAPVPYNVHLVSPEDPAAMSFRIAGPAGDYNGVSLLLGLNDVCNRNNPGASQPPLTDSSQMTWPPPFGFLFLRYAGKTVGAPAEVPTQIDLGGLPGINFAPRVTAPGSLKISGPASTIRLRVALDEIFKAAALPITVDPGSVAPPLGPPFMIGEHVRQNAPKVAIFSLLPSP